jgi:hypothetical protein
MLSGLETVALCNFFWNGNGFVSVPIRRNRKAAGISYVLATT